MTNKNMVLLICAALLVMAMPMVAAEDAPSMYFVPNGGNGNCGEVTQIDLMVNTSESSGGANGWIYFDPACINITDMDFSESPWTNMTGPGWSHNGSYVSFALINFAGVGPGVYKISTIDVNCTGCNCTSKLNITKAEPIGVIAYNTTFTCNTTEEPDVAEISIGDGVGFVTIPIVVNNATNVGAVDVTLKYDTSVVNVVGVIDGDMDITIPNTNYTNSGWIRVGAFQGISGGIDGQFTIASVVFEPVGNISSCQLEIVVNTLYDATHNTNAISYTISNGMYDSSLNGDVNDDGLVDVADAMYIARYVVGITGFDEINEDAADVNGDGVIDIADAMYLAKHIIEIAGFEELR